MNRAFRTAVMALLLLALPAGAKAARFSGNCLILAMKPPTTQSEFAARPFAGNQAGYDSAIAYVGSEGIIQIHPGCSGQINLGTLPSLVQVIYMNTGVWEYHGASSALLLRDAVPGGNGPTDPTIFSQKTLDLTTTANSQAAKSVDIKSIFSGTTSNTGLSLNGLHAINQYGVGGVGGGNFSNGIALGGYSEHRGDASVTGSMYGGEFASSMYNTGSILNAFGSLSTAQILGGPAQVTTLRGAQGLARVYGTGNGTVGTAVGSEGAAGFQVSSTGTITDAIGGRFFTVKDVGTTGVITNAYGVSISAIAQGSANNYGLRVFGASGGSNNNQSIRVDAGESYFGGKVTLADSARVAKTLQLGSSIYANLVNNGNGTIVYCSDCTQTNPCGGGGTGALARREGGAWNCGGGAGGGGGSAAFDTLANNAWIYWKNTGGVEQPVIKVDSVNTLRFQMLSSSNWDTYLGDGTLGIRYYGGGANSGIFNVTGGTPGFALGGYNLLKDSGKERRIILKGQIAGPGAWLAVRDSAEANNLSILTDRFGDGWMSGSWNVGDSLAVTGPSLLTKAVVSDSLRVGSSSTARNAIVSGDLTAWGKGVVDDSLRVGNSATAAPAIISGDATVWGKVVADDSLRVGNSATKRPLIVSGDVTSYGSGTFADSSRVGTSAAAKSLTVSGDLNTYGNVHMGYGSLYMNASGNSDKLIMARPTATTLEVHIPSAGGVINFVDASSTIPLTVTDDGRIVLARSTAFASLGTPSNGSIAYCSDCAKTTPCTGSGSGTIAFRNGGSWDCSLGGTAGFSPVTADSSIGFTFPSGSQQTVYMACSGAVAGKAASLGTAPIAGVVFEAYCVANNVVGVRATRTCDSSATVSAQNFHVEVFP